MRPLDRLAGPAMRPCAQPANARLRAPAQPAPRPPRLESNAPRRPASDRHRASLRDTLPGAHDRQGSFSSRRCPTKRQLNRVLRLCDRLQRRCRLVHDVAPCACAHVAAHARPLLQHDQPIGYRQRVARVGIFRQVSIQVGARQHDHDGPIRVSIPPRADRFVTASRMQRHQAICLRQLLQAPAAPVQSHGSRSRRKRAQRADVRQLPLLACAP